LGRSLEATLAAALGAEPEEEATEEREWEHREDGARDEVGDPALVVVEGGAAHRAGVRELGDEREERGKEKEAAHR